MIVGIDMGATQLRAGIIRHGQLMSINSALLDKKSQPASLAEQVKKLIPDVYLSQIKGIGMGIPGLADTERGIAYDLLNIPGWEEIPIRQLFEKRFHVPIFINNDANCFIAGEYHYGKARGSVHSLGLTLGTGMGTGVIIGGSLLNGQYSGFGELGMLPYRDGILEHYSSGMYFDRMAGLSGTILYQRALCDDPSALSHYANYGYHLGQAIKIALYAYAPEIIILGGSISKAYPFFKASMHEAIRNFSYPRLLKNLVITVSDMPHAAIFGAASLVKMS